MFHRIDCAFCRIADGTDHHPAAIRPPTEIIFETPYSVAFEPLNPVVPGHTLVIPRDHVVDFTHDLRVSARTMYDAAELAQTLRGQADINLITSAGRAATQTVLHLHIHLVPRHPGDGLALPWTERS